MGVTKITMTLMVTMMVSMIIVNWYSIILTLQGVQGPSGSRGVQGYQASVSQKISDVVLGCYGVTFKEFWKGLCLEWLTFKDGGL